MPVYSPDEKKQLETIYDNSQSTTLSGNISQSDKINSTQLNLDNITADNSVKIGLDGTETSSIINSITQTFSNLFTTTSNMAIAQTANNAEISANAINANITKGISQKYVLIVCGVLVIVFLLSLFKKGRK